MIWHPVGSVPISTELGFHPVALSSSILIPFASGEVLEKMQVHRNETVFYQSVQLLAYRDDIDIINTVSNEVLLPHLVL